MVGPVETVELRGPHLVLAHLGRDDSVSTGEVVELLDHELGLDAFALLVGERLGLLPGLDALEPFLARGGRHRFGSIVQQRVQALQARAAVADDRDADRDVLADRGGVDVDVHDRGLGGEGVRLARDPVVEPDPDRQEQVAGAGAMLAA